MARKARVTIPKGTKDCHGLECDKNYEFDIDVPEADVSVTTIPTPGVQLATVANPGQPQTLIVQPPAPQATVPPPKEESKDL